MGDAFQPNRDLLGETEPTADLVLGAPALLGIFFAAALLCAVCFGFGYSSGHTVRRTPLVESDQTAIAAQQEQTQPMDRVEAPPTAILTHRSPDAPVTTPLQDDSSGTEPGFPPAETASPVNTKPAPGTGYMARKQAAAAVPPADSQDLPASRSRAAQDQNATARSQGVAVPLTATPRATPADTPAATGEAPSQFLMVQIAAVSHAADAQTLAAALRHDGFAAVVRTSTGDPLFHIQIGPFPTLQAAKAMRARLSSVGYNAFIKP